MKRSNITKESQTERLDKMTDKDIDLTDIPEITPELFARAVVRHDLKPDERKELITIRVDRDILTWFRAQGRGYQTRINALLRAYMETHVQHRG